MLIICLPTGSDPRTVQGLYKGCTGVVQGLYKGCTRVVMSVMSI